MITISMFNVLAVMALAMLVYAMIDYENKMYAHIAMAFISGFVFLYLGTAIGTGIVYDPTGAAANTDASLSVLLQFLAVVAWVYTLLMSAMAYFAWKRQKAEKLALRENEGLL